MVTIRACLLISLLLPPTAAWPSPSYTVPDSLSAGAVFGYGLRLASPFLFTGIGSDTLRLNGMAYDPRPVPTLSSQPRTPTPNTAAPPTTQSIQPPDVLAARIEELSNAVRDTLASARSQRTLQSTEQAALAAQVISQRQDIEWAHVSGNSVSYKFRDDAGRFSILYFDAPTAPPLSRADVHRSLITTFETALRRGGLVAFGSGYAVFGPPNQCAHTLALLAEIHQGGSNALTTPDLVGTPLTCGAFLEDVLRRRQ